MQNAPTVLNATGQTYKDFLVTKYLQLSELQSSLVELVHIPSGARIMHIAKDDPENLFCLSFQTLPYNSNGIAHILEHTVLCGSEKFPVKDPFFAMTRRSLNTYMNALTGQDFTCYPASSQVEKDFYNLLEVYLDSVFHPQLKFLSFLQEGHRLEFLGDQLHFSGVVYNEMKGAMSSVDSRLWETLTKRLLPDLPYMHNSGGNPKDIPLLTYQELLDFHREFYHPSRCIFFFYGDLPLASHLDFLEKELKQAKKLAPLSLLPLQKRFEIPQFVEDSFPVTEGEDLKCQIAFAWLTAPISNQKEILALDILLSILTDTDASPLTMALLKSGLCTQVETALDSEMSEVPFVIICKGVESEAAPKLQKVIFDTIKSAVFSKDEIEAALHGIEFERTEIGGEGVPFGLTLFMRAALLKHHGCEPENALLIHSLFSELRNHLTADPKYLNKILEKYILNNPHFVQLTLKPDPELSKKELLEEAEKIKKISSSLTKEDEKRIKDQTVQLKAYQEEIEHQSLDCLPKITLQDVPSQARDYPLIQEENVFHHSCFTNQILYLDLVFDLPELAREDLPLLSFFAKILPELGCGGRSYEENLAYQQRYIGGFDSNLSLHVLHENPDVCKPTFTIRGKALYHNEDKLFQLFSDAITSLDVMDKERVKEWLSQHATDQKEKLHRASMSYATQASLKALSIPSYIHEKWHGISYYESVLAWQKNFDDKFLDRLKNMRDSILGLKKTDWVVCCDEKHYEELKKKGAFQPKLPLETTQAWIGSYSLPLPSPQACFIAAPVAFTSLGMRTISFLNPDSSKLLIASELMKNVILHKEIREKGGAYGSGAHYTPSIGNFNFYAYRDPNLKKSMDAFHLAIDHIGNELFNDRELEEAKLSVLQTLDAPVSPGHRAYLAYSWQRAGRNYALRNEFRKSVIHATKEQVARAVKKHLGEQKGILVSFLGKELFMKEEEKLGFPVPVISI